MRSGKPSGQKKNPADEKKKMTSNWSSSVSYERGSLHVISANLAMNRDGICALKCTKRAQYCVKNRFQRSKPIRSWTFTVLPSFAGDNSNTQIIGAHKLKNALQQLRRFFGRLINRLIRSIDELIKIETCGLQLAIKERGQADMNLSPFKYQMVLNAFITFPPVIPFWLGWGVTDCGSGHFHQLS